MNNSGYLSIFLALFCLSCSIARSSRQASALQAAEFGPQATFSVMAPLVVQDPLDPDSEDSEERILDFKIQLAAMKALGVDGVTTDVWWGLTEKEDDKFDFSYYDRLASLIIGAGLKWVPILSFHQCGGNVGDSCDVPIPAWIFPKLARLKKGFSPVDFQYRSEQNNVSREVVSAWATPYALADYRAFMLAFREHFRSLAPHILEINISLGPAGELRYPSYNSHDTGSGYPTRGALQAYSRLALLDWQRFVETRYQNVSALNEAWGKSHAVKRIADVRPPTEVDAFFAEGMHTGSQFGRDFFDWYAESLIRHGETMMGLAIETLSTGDSPFVGIDLGAKIPGIHWRIGSRESGELVLADRLAELNAGLIRTSRGDWHEDKDGRGYRELLSVFKRLSAMSYPTRVVLHFTCLEMPDEQDPGASSMAKSLVQWVGNEAARQNVILKGENALGWNVPNEASWNHMESHLKHKTNRQGRYEGLTILRMSDVYASEMATRRLGQIIRRYGGSGE